MNEWIRQVRMAVTGLWSPCQPTPEEVVCELVAMQAQEHPYARWSVAQRVEPTADAATVDVTRKRAEVTHFTCFLSPQEGMIASVAALRAGAIPFHPCRPALVQKGR